ncbi:glycoside hydrolase family 25 protein [Roseovarius aestuarii]|uniref:Lysozyme n=1 Tax=Roseovarius aestuarii TaxID=475083 RepID=A0A1X7BMG8_9RHOB|nr:GH25 family lysozyme [Roseovarius aestuarii]SMC10832.1 Lysozyme M1 precursor [Roseovarius aestuarii]
MPRLAHLLLPFLLACASALPAYAQTRADAGTPATVRFGDSKPVNWTGRAPDRYQIHGIDVARFQGEIDWRKARRAGVSFVFMKATEGGDLLDPLFKDHWRGAKRAGIPRGAYHFYYFCTPPEVQARWFIRNVPKNKGTLPPVLDMEWNPFSPTCAKVRPPGHEVRRQMKVFMDMVERRYGQRPIIYTTPQFYRDAGLDRLKNEEFWLRSTAKTPAQAYPQQRWSFWQYSGTGLIDGIGKEVDLNVFAGSPNNWSAWLKARQR